MPFHQLYALNLLHCYHSSASEIVLIAKDCLEIRYYKISDLTNKNLGEDEAWNFQSYNIFKKGDTLFKKNLTH